MSAAADSIFALNLTAGITMHIVNNNFRILPYTFKFIVMPVFCLTDKKNNMTKGKLKNSNRSLKDAAMSDWLWGDRLNNYIKTGYSIVTDFILSA